MTGALRDGKGGALAGAGVPGETINQIVTAIAPLADDIVSRGLS